MLLCLIDLRIVLHERHQPPAPVLIVLSMSLAEANVQAAVDQEEMICAELQGRAHRTTIQDKLVETGNMFEAEQMKEAMEQVWSAPKLSTITRHDHAGTI